MAAMATDSLVVVDAPPELIGAVLKRLASRGEATATARMSRKMVEEKIGRVTVTYSGRDYVEFHRDIPDASELLKLGAFRAEFNGREIIFEEDCLTCRVSGLREALDVVKDLASALGVALPLSACKRRLELYVWDEPKTHEVIVE